MLASSVVIASVAMRASGGRRLGEERWLFSGTTVSSICAASLTSVEASRTASVIIAVAAVMRTLPPEDHVAPVQFAVSRRSVSGCYLLSQPVGAPTVIVFFSIPSVKVKIKGGLETHRGN